MYLKVLTAIVIGSLGVAYGKSEGNKIDLNIQNCSTFTYKDLIELKDDDIRIPPSKKGSSHTILIKAGVSSAEGIEKKRKSRIVEDIGTLANIGGMIKSTKKKCIQYTQTHKRTILELTTIDVKKKKSNYILTAGVAEHWYMSADMPVNSVKQLSYDSTNNKLIEKEKPASFYIGLNYKLGDIFTNYKAFDFHNITLKGLVKASSSPSESIGLGLGYDFKYFELFVASVWTKDDENIPEQSIGHTNSVIFGISFNLNKGLSWVKP